MDAKSESNSGCTYLRETPRASGAFAGLAQGPCGVMCEPSCCSRQGSQEEGTADDAFPALASRVLVPGPPGARKPYMFNESNTHWSLRVSFAPHP